MRHIRNNCIILFVMLLLFAGSGLVDDKTGEEINWQVISSGGTKGSSASYELEGTVGQPVIGEGSSATYHLSHGFWQVFGGGFPEEPPLIKIEKVPTASVGQTTGVSITTEDVEFESGGFNMLVSYDTAVLSVIQATPGQLLEDCGWEQFSYAAGPSPGLLSIEAVADIDNGGIHPSCYGPPDRDPHELLEMEFQIIALPSGGDSLTPINFYWIACEDNSFVSISEETTYVDRRIYDVDGNLIWDEDDDISYPEDARIPFVGAPDTCLDVDPDSLAPIRAINFQFGGIICTGCCNGDGIRGDADNSSGSPNVGDLSYLVSYLFDQPPGPAPPCFEEGDVDASSSINVGDLSHLVSYLFDQPPGPAPEPCP